MQIIILLFKISLFYLIVIKAYHLIGKTKVDEFSLMDFVVFLTLSNLFTISIILNDESFFYVVCAAVIIITLQTIMPYLASSISGIKYIFNTPPSMIIKNGKLDFKEIVKREYNFNKLLNELKRKNIKSIEQVEYAYLDKDEKISIATKDDKNILYPIILNGKIQYTSLKLLKKDIRWIKNIIETNKLDVEKIFYAFYKENSVYIIQNNY
ncbi:MAG TPA: DUF421 domain-containing protein [Mollicutes bacterium]|nr:DUF421 domain-containing protein [Mollicutes bacterium]